MAVLDPTRPPSAGPYVILSPEPWTEVQPTNKHQLAKQFARASEVLYVDLTPVSVRKRRLPAVRTRSVGTNLRVLDTVGFPQRFRAGSPAVFQAQTALTLAATREMSKRILSSRPSVILVYFPLPPRLLRQFSPANVIYHCVDHHPTFPAWQRMADQLDAWERELALSADFVFASSTALADRLGHWRDDVTLLPNVGDVSLFEAAGDSARAAHHGSPTTPLTVFFHGTLSSHKIDFAFIRTLAHAVYPNTVLIVGDAADDAARIHMRSLGEIENVRWKAAMPPTAVATEMARADLLMLPYAQNPHTEHVFPLKLTEYLASGMPLIATPLRSIVEFCGDSIEYAAANDDLAGAINSAISSGEAGRARRRLLVEGRTWETRATEIRKIIDSSKRNAAPHEERW